MVVVHYFLTMPAFIVLARDTITEEVADTFPKEVWKHPGHHPCQIISEMDRKFSGEF